MMTNDSNKFIDTYIKYKTHTKMDKTILVLQRCKDKIHQKIQALFERLALEEITEGEYNEKISKLKQESLKIEEEISQKEVLLVNDKNKINSFQRFIIDNQGFEKLDKLSLIKALIRNVIVSVSENGKIKFNNQYKFEL